MIIKIYLLLWALLALATAVLYVIGYLHPLVIAALGLVGVGLCFMGMMSVVPTLLEHEAK